ncbi:efflux RND transporter periplasmic adaptor subunit [Aquimarina gracilis]|uniref:Efflux RND transporter periplasmic adaptor subunit n=1 Tax=Aquimarina gracilis TaxID=874422 RepID=A0ABU5ZVJ4_9FLAO|nr:efflux RND transporter periplasmic adaptor subunit [Aquimarina gracilis]MEB3345646.1 efflux RND transporter periplasmic adaptor subunit [Aquimarina gracilis]
MDRVIDQSIVKKKKRRTIYKVSLISLFLLMALWILTVSFFEKSIHREEITINTAEIGEIEDAISTVGKLEPEYEEVIISPVSSIIEKVYLSEGVQVDIGDTIMSLNKDILRNKLLEQRNLFEVEKSKLAKIQLDLRKNQHDLVISDKVKALEISKLQDDRKTAEKLLEIGGGTGNDVEKIRKQLEILNLEKKKSEFDLKSLRSSMAINKNETNVSLTIQEQAIKTIEENLEKADVRAPRKGVITYLNTEIGGNISEGEILVKLADLGSYVVTGSISDSYSDMLYLDMPAYIEVNDQKFPGKISSINPEIKDNQISFRVRLDNSFDKIFKPKMKVEIHLIAKEEKKAIRVANGTSFIGPKELEVFVLQDDNYAVKRSVKIGMANKDYVQIISGVKPGESVITAGLEKFENIKKIKIID